MSSLRLSLVLQTCLLFEGALSQQGMAWKTQVEIEEHGVRYNQTVEYDRITTAVTITVPKHINVDASTVILHKPSNTRMLLDPARGFCQLRTVPDDFDPQDMVLSSFARAGNREVLTPGMAKEVQLMQVPQGKLSVSKRKQLLKSIQDLCRGLPIYVIKEVAVTDEETGNGFLTLNATSAHRRAKRSFQCDYTTFCDATADRCVPSGDTRYCVWYTCTRKDPAGNCNVTHVASSTWKCTLCCYKGRQPGMCGCNEIYSKATLDSCQARQFTECG